MYMYAGQSPGASLPERRRRSVRTALLGSLVLHALAAVVATVLLMMRTDIYEVLDALEVEWVEMPDALRPMRKRLKVPVPQKLEDPDRPVARPEPDKLMRQANNPITEVARFSQRTVFQDVERNPFPKVQQVPPLMTAADLTLTSDVTNIAQMRSLPSSREDGRGQVTGRTRVQGSGLGSMLFNSRGAGDGLLGGGGRAGVADPLRILDFLRGRGEQGKIVYVLDVSASMGAAGLRKLDLAKISLLDHLFLLGEKDQFNVITFWASVGRLDAGLLPATAENLTRAKRYLDRFTQQSITEYWGTNTLGAIEAALTLRPDVVVLLTDGVPTSEGGMKVETDPDRIVQAVRSHNTSNAALFIVGLEIDIEDTPNAPGAILLRRLAEQTNGRIKFVGRDELARYRERLEASASNPP
jgi:hypothetical protein